MDMMAEAPLSDVTLTPALVISSLSGVTRGKIQYYAAGETDQPGTTTATPGRESPRCSSTSTPAGPLAHPDTTFIHCKTTPSRKRKASDPPEWVKTFDAKLDRLVAVQEEKNRLLKEKNRLLKEKNHLLTERNDLLRDFVHGSRPNLNMPHSS